MRIKKTKFKKNGLLNFYLITLQTCLKTKSSKNVQLFLNRTVGLAKIHLKTALRVIHEYHYNKRKILFLGTPCAKKKYFLKRLKPTKHSCIKLTPWVPGIFKNSSMFLQQSSKFKNRNRIQGKRIYSKKIQVSLELIKRPDLIVVLEPNPEQRVLKEVYRLNLPVIFFNKESSYLQSSSDSDYGIKGYFPQLDSQRLGDLLTACIIRPVKQRRPVKWRQTRYKKLKKLLDSIFQQ